MLYKSLEVENKALKQELFKLQKEYKKLQTRFKQEMRERQRLEELLKR